MGPPVLCGRDRFGIELGKARIGAEALMRDAEHARLAALSARHRGQARRDGAGRAGQAYLTKNVKIATLMCF